MSNPAYPELLEGLAVRAAELLCAEGLSKDKARVIGFKLAESVRQDWGGQLVYVPVGTGYEISERDREIWEAFKGDNHEQLARQFDVTVVHVYRIVKKMAQAARARDQRDLFNSSTVVSSAAPKP
jgi:Mor family transcriptional regulator